MGNLISFSVEDNKVFLNSYKKIFFKDIPGLVDASNIQFLINQGNEFAEVSVAHREPQEGTWSIMFRSKHEPGTYTVEAKDKYNNSLGKIAIEVIDKWPYGDHNDQGPPKVFSVHKKRKIVPYELYLGDLKNFNVLPGTQQMNVAIVLLKTKEKDDSASSLGSDEATSLRDYWYRSALSGIDDEDGIGRSAAKYFDQVSTPELLIDPKKKPNFSMKVKVFGPYVLDSPWIDPVDGGGTYVDDKGYAYRDQFFAAAFRAIKTGPKEEVDELSNPTSRPDLIIFTLKTMGKSEFIWPAEYDCVEDPDLAYSGPVICLPSPMIIQGPDGRATFDEPMPGKEGCENLVHEIAHAIGFLDQYDKYPPIGTWDPMDKQSVFPFFSLPHKIMTNWLQKSGAIQCVKFSADQQRIPIKLYPSVEPPPEKGITGVQISLTKGDNAYIEYRVRRQTGVGDRQLEKDRAILGLRLTTPGKTSECGRYALTLLEIKSDDPKNHRDFVIGTEDIFPKEYETEIILNKKAGTKRNFKVVVKGMSDFADIDLVLEKIPLDSLDLSILPPSPQFDYVSRSICVENELCKAYKEIQPNNAIPLKMNVPWPGHKNTIWVKVENEGIKDANGAMVTLYERSFGPDQSFDLEKIEETGCKKIDDIKFDLPAGKSDWVKLEGWIPPLASNKAIIARVQPDANLKEDNQDNNFGFRNYARLCSKLPDYPNTEKLTLEVRNPIDKDGTIVLSVNNEDPLFNIYLDHDNAMIRANGSATFELWAQYTAIGQSKEETVESSKRHSVVVVEARLEYVIEEGGADPANEKHSIRKILQLGGSRIILDRGLESKFASFEAENNEVRGTVVDYYDNNLQGGKVIVSINPGLDEKTIPVDVVNGAFSLKLNDYPDWKKIEAAFVPPNGYAPCSLIKERC